MRLPYRPQPDFRTFSGQTTILNDLRSRVGVSRNQHLPFGHMLFVASAGMGKATLAKALAKELRVIYRDLDAMNKLKRGDLALAVTKLEPNDILIIENIERLTGESLNVLTSILENNILNITVGKGTAAKDVSVSLPVFSVIGTTTKPSRLSQKIEPWLYRRYIFSPYSLQEMIDICILLSAQNSLLLDNRQLSFWRKKLTQYRVAYLF